MNNPYGPYSLYPIENPIISVKTMKTILCISPQCKNFDSYILSCITGAQVYLEMQLQSLLSRRKISFFIKDLFHNKETIMPFGMLMMDKPLEEQIIHIKCMKGKNIPLDNIEILGPRTIKFKNINGSLYVTYKPYVLDFHELHYITMCHMAEQMFHRTFLGAQDLQKLFN